MGDFLNLERGKRPSSGAFLSLEKEFSRRPRVSATDIDYGAEFLPAVNAFEEAARQPVLLNPAPDRPAAKAGNHNPTAGDDQGISLGDIQAGINKMVSGGSVIDRINTVSPTDDNFMRERPVRVDLGAKPEAIPNAVPETDKLNALLGRFAGSTAQSGIGLLRAFGEHVLPEGRFNGTLQVLEELSKRAQQAQNTGISFDSPEAAIWGNSAINAGSSIGQMGLAGLTGNPLLAMGALEAGNTYDDMRNSGFSPSESLVAGGLNGVWEAGFEKMAGADKLVSNIAKGIRNNNLRGIGRAMMDYSLAEQPGELGTTLFQNTTNAAFDPSRLGTLGDDMKETARATALQGLFMGVPGAGLHVAGRVAARKPGTMPAQAGIPDMDPVNQKQEPSQVRGFTERMLSALKEQREQSENLLAKLAHNERQDPATAGNTIHEPVKAQPGQTPVDVLIANGGVKASDIGNDYGWRPERLSELPDGIATEKGMGIQAANDALHRAGFNVTAEDVLDSASRPQEEAGDFAKLEEEILREQQAAEKLEQPDADSMDPENGTQSDPADVTGSQMSLFSVPENPNMMALHNLTGDNLAYADRMGGLAVPSIGVVTDRAGDVKGFGDISLIGRKPLADPLREPVYSSDAYTARYPDAEWDKVSSKEALSLTESMDGIAREFDDSLSHSTYESMVRRPDAHKVINTWLHSDAARAKFLREEKGIDVKPVYQNAGQKVDLSRTRELVKTKIEPFNHEYRKWVESKIMPYFAEPHLKLRGKKVPYTLPNIVDSMVANKGKGREKSMTFGTGQTRAAAAHQFSDLEEMRGHAKERIVDHDQYMDTREQTEKLLDEYRKAVIDYSRYETWTALDSSMKALAKLIKRKKQDMSALKTALRSEGFDVAAMPQDVLEKAFKAGKALYETPVPYFEAKPQRAVSLSEFAGAVIPKNASAEVREILKKHGIETVEYEGDRTQAVRDFAARLNKEGKETLFQKGRQGGSDVESIQKAIASDPVNRIAKVVQSVNDLPENIRREVERAGTDVEGIYHPKDGVYLIADNLTPDRAVNVARHEVIGHYGIEQMLGADLMEEGVRKVRQGLERQNKLIVELSEEVKRRQPGLDDVAHAKEVIALMAERNLHEIGFVRRMLDAIRRFLHRIGVVSLDTSDADIAAMLRDAREYLARKGQQERSSDESGNRELDRQFDEVVRQYRDTPQWMKAPNGEPTKLSEHQWVQVRTQNFKDWFGDWEADATRNEGLREALRGEGSVYPGTDRKSSTADSGLHRSGFENENSDQTVRDGKSGRDFDTEGRVLEESIRRLGALNLLDPDTLEPRVFYHGTKDSFTRFDPDHPNKKDAGWFGKGIYLTGDAFIADEYSRRKRGEGERHTMHLFASLKNPLVLSMDEKNRLNINTPKQAEAYTNKLKKQGYDGVIAYNFNYPDFYDSPEVVVFSPERVKSATDNVGSFSSDDPDIRYSRDEKTDNSQYDQIVSQYKNTAEWMKAPNGEPTKLSEHQWVQVRTQNFKDWFGDWQNDPDNSSKVLDENGEPLVVYHGTVNDFSVFGDEETVQSWRNSLNKDGEFFFTDDSNLAGDYAKAFSEGGEPANVMPVFLSIKDARIVEANGLTRKTEKFIRDQLSHMWNDENDGLIIKHIDDSVIGRDDDYHNPQATIYVVTERIQIKSATGNNGNFSESENILFSRQKDETENSESAFSFTIPEPTLFDSILRENQDKNIDVKRVQDTIREWGGYISDAEDAYMREGHYLGRVKERLDKLQKTSVNPIIQAVSDAKISIEEAGDWLYARHVINDNVNAWLAEVAKSKNKSLSGMDDELAQYIIAKYEKNPHVQKLGVLVDAMMNDTRELMVASGLESRGTINAWKKRYAHYVPLIRDAEGVKKEGAIKEKFKSLMHSGGRRSSFDVQGAESERRLGDRRRAKNVLGNVIAQAQGTIIRAEKARVARSLYDLANKYKNVNLWQIDQPVRKRRINPETGLIEIYFDRPAQDNTLTVKINGTEHWITFNKNNERAMQIARSYKSLDAAQMPWVVQAIGDMTRYLSKWITTNNPVFALNNFRRDIQHALFNLADTTISGKGALVLKNVFPAMRGYWQAAREKTYNNREANFAREFRDAGGETGFVKSFSTINDRMADLEKQLKVLNESNYDPRKWSRITVNVLEEFNSIVENGVRLSVYMVARENGSSIQKAADIAKNITVDFNRKGRASGWYNALYMFANANIQGHARTLAAISKSKKARVIAAALVGLGALMDVVGRAMMGDDDETGKKVWDEIQDFDKERNWIIPLGGKHYMKIALPQGLHVLPNLGRMLSELAFSSRKQDVLEKASRFALLTADAFNPFGSSGSVSQFISPSVTKPIVMIAENKGFTGSRLRRDDAPFGGLNTPAYSKAYQGTPDYWTAMSQFLNDHTGGDDVTPGRVNIAPETLRLAATSYILPGTSSNIDRMINVFSKFIQGKELEARDYPAVSQTYGVAPDERAQEREYFEMMSDWKQKVLQAKRYQKEGRRDDLNSTLSELGDGNVRVGMRRAKLFDRYEKQMAELNREKKRLEEILKKYPERKFAEIRLEHVQSKRKRLIREFLNRADQ